MVPHPAPKNLEKISEWLAGVSKITPASITTHFHLSKPSHLPYTKKSRKKISEWLADVSKITPTSITTHFHLSKSSHLPHRKKLKIVYFLLFSLCLGYPLALFVHPSTAHVCSVSALGMFTFKHHMFKTHFSD